MKFQKIANFLAQPKPERTFAYSRMEAVIGRVFSLASLGLGIEMSVNAWAQVSLLNPIWFLATWVLVFGSVVGLFISHWFFQGGRVFYLAYAVAVAFTVLTWGFQVSDLSKFDSGFTPWIYWNLGIACLSAGLGLRGYFAWPYIGALPVYWAFLRLTPEGGGVTELWAAQDAAYSFFFAATFTSLVQLLRYETRVADAASAAASDAIAEQARVDAQERERLRIDSLIHERILATLALSREARTEKEFVEVKHQAASAIADLRAFESDSVNQDVRISAKSFCSSLARIIDTHFEKVEVKSDCRGELLLSSEAASALTEAAMEAVRNAKQFAGGQANVSLKIKAYEDSIKLVVIDDGKGFRPSRVPKNRLGIRLAIRARMESVGGSAKIDSRPGHGCTVILEWEDSQK